MKNKSWSKRILPVFIIASIAIIICWLIQLGIVNAKVVMAEAQMSREQGRIISGLSTQNEALKNKLQASAKIVTSETTKQVVRFYLQKYFGTEAQIAEKVFTCESNLQPLALNDKNTNGSTDRGVPQINSSNRVSFERVTGKNYDLFAHDIETSIMYAKWLKDNSKSGWGNWTCYSIIAKEVAKL